MRHGGAQGDSGDMGCTLVTIRRTEHRRGVHLWGLRPDDPGLAVVVAEAPKLRLSFGGREEVLENGFSDDQRPVSSSAGGLAQLLHTPCQGCWEIGCSVNSSMLRAIRVALLGGRFLCQGHSIATVVGPLAFETSGLHLLGEPCLWGRPRGGHQRRLETLSEGAGGDLPCAHPRRIVSARRSVQGFLVSRLSPLCVSTWPKCTWLQMADQPEGVAACPTAVRGCRGPRPHGAAIPAVCTRRRQGHELAEHLGEGE